MEIGIKLKITPKNHRLVDARIGKGHYKAIDLIKAINYSISYNTYISIENLRQNPGAKAIKILCEYFNEDQECLFPKISKNVKTSLRKLRVHEYKVIEAKKLISGLRPDNNLIEMETKDMCNKALQNLPDREKKMLELRYYENKSLSQCGNELGISKERARQIQEKALKKLRHPSITRKLRGVV